MSAVWSTKLPGETNGGFTRLVSIYAMKRSGLRFLSICHVGYTKNSSEPTAE